MHNARTLLGGLVLLLGLAINLPVQAAQLLITDAATGEPLEDAVIEVHHPGPGKATEEQEIIQRDATFLPLVSVVAVGSRVSFPNRDTTRHHVFSFSPAKVFDLELYLQETPPPIHMDQAGVVVLGCNIHDQMQAFIVVSDAQTAGQTSRGGRLTLSDLPGGSHRLRVWHPRLEDTHQQWWEGEIRQGQALTIALDLQASLPVAEEPSELQQRFRQALQEQGT